MAGFYRYETANLDIELLADDVFEDYTEIVVSISQKMGAKIHKRSEDLVIDTENNLLTVRLSQEETAQFVRGEALIQVNIMYADSERETSSQSVIEIWDNLYDEVM